MNSSLIFVITIVAIVMGSQVIKYWIKVRHTSPVTDDDLTVTLKKMDELEERVKVLERIVTENRFDLRQQIDSL